MMGGGGIGINGLPFDIGRIDFEIALGSIETLAGPGCSGSPTRFMSRVCDPLLEREQRTAAPRKQGMEGYATRFW